MPKLLLAWLFSLLPLLPACTEIPSAQERQNHADALVAAKGWQRLRIPAGRFDVAAYVPQGVSPGQTLTIYIEGDGFAWVSSDTPSTDPTPREPLALELALEHPAGNAAYLARPCQYVDARLSGCDQRYWTEARFAPEVIEAESSAVDILKERFGAHRLVLVGYSGGGAVAALLAARRNDVSRLVTVAGNLDQSAWAAYHRVKPLAGSLNAADEAGRLVHVPQTHFVGGRDRVIPPELAMRWPKAMTGSANANLRIIPDFDHVCCWAKHWSSLFLQD